MSPDSTPRELAKKTSQLLAVLTGIGTLILLQALDAMHLWAVAILAALLTETLSTLIIEWSVEKILQRRVQDLSDAMSQSSSVKEVRLEEQSLEDILTWANNQLADIKSLKAKDSFRKEFIGNLAHELKTPLFNIQGFILTLIESDLKDKALVRRFLHKADNNVSRMTELIEDLDTITKLESDSLSLTLAPCNIVDTCKEAIDEVESKALKMGISVRLELPDPEMESLHVLCGPVQIRQVLTNLLGNSIHYGVEGGESTLRLEAEGETVRITVEDNGIGISKEDLNRIYERFYRVDKSRSRHAGGSGLGLAIVKHIIEAHGQSIQVQSALNKGTAFSFELVNLDAEAEKRNIQLDAPDLV